MDEWVDGTNLATEQIGGSEGLRRLRDLRVDGYAIQQRRHPDPGRDIWQYRLINKPEVSPLRQASSMTGNAKIVFGQNTLCRHCSGTGKRHSQDCEACGGKGWT